MKTLARAIAINIANNSGKPVSVNVLAYALEAVLGEIIKFVIFAIIGLILNCLFEMLTIVISFAILRASTGGAHCSSYMRCLLLGIMTFTPLAILATMATTTSLAVIIIISVLFASYTIFKHVPGEWHQRKLKKEKHIYQNGAIISIIVITTISVIMLLSENQLALNIGLAMQLAVIWQLFNVLPLGNKFIITTDKFMIKITTMVVKRRCKQ